ncbi:GNAT family N-acetyltransferase [Burkholderia sp. BCC0322]|uniref:GNAT family N-acetyltransferase n=1 Tax=unclassified Burkholderia TaxID=2613784 RepID=UPI001FC8A221|nr:GNAT family N-acetyltransferase [Burkholderia sp. BCC0322]
MRFTISSVQADDTYPLRGEILLDSDEKACVLPGDDCPTTLHLAVSSSATIVAVATVCEESPPGLRDSNAWRLRGMAVRPEVRDLGFGRLLVQLCVRYAREHQATEIWCTARESAHGFYEKLGFITDTPALHMHGRTDMRFYVMRRQITH